MPTRASSRAAERACMALAAGLLILDLASCYHWAETSESPSVIVSNHHPLVMRLRTDSGRLTVYAPVVVKDSIVGTRHPVGNTTAPASDHIAVPVTQIRSAQIQVMDSHRTKMVFLYSILLITSGIILFNLGSDALGSFGGI
jgi:hypothetical protein